ncbi:DMT family transporter [Stutzerimonas zhaodongensis]|uniref:DMT family transporter n=1 Tax=Stutzerimonas zhaodongensis TaxID=1176257 RepID=A0A3M2HRN4_9GAMM|nr:DMT family transporter [Stutzerimonas zhaodongensis]MCQ4314912.1 DMT family transporter [Stutzerimonas zhaodongensis]RMH92406.1 DMT family transporter [Stutzerimonas zhaodongensis]
MKDSARGLLLVTSGIFVLSFDGLLVRLAQADGWSIVFWRGLLMFLALGVFSLSAKSRASIMKHSLISAGSALLLAFTSIFFVLAVIHTTIANVVVVLSTAPLFAALFTRFFLRERVALHTWLAIGAAALGIVIVFAGTFTPTDLAGNGYALLSSAAVGANLTLLRRHPAIDRMPLIALGGLAGALIALPNAQPFGLGATSYWALAVMGLVQMPLATLMINNATRYLPSAEVALFYLLESVLGSLWAWYFLHETPASATLYGGALVIATLVVHAGLTLRPRAALPA